MSSTQPNGEAPAPATNTVELLPWQLAEIRRQLYIDLMNVAEHVAEEASRASQMNRADTAQNILGSDIEAFAHGTLADAVNLLDAIGWDIKGDTALLIEHGMDRDGVPEDMREWEAEVLADES